jgi:peptidylprolyl isomerase
MIKNGSTVEVHYTGKLTDGVVFDTSVGKEPLKFTIGEGQLIPGFENAVIDKNIGDKLTVTIEPSQAYGDFRPDLIVEVPLDKMPGDVEIGQNLQAVSDNGNPINVTIMEIHESHVVIDANHPLAGKNLLFEIEVVSVN